MSKTYVFPIAVALVIVPIYLEAGRRHSTRVARLGCGGSVVKCRAGVLSRGRTRPPWRRGCTRPPRRRSSRPPRWRGGAQRRVSRRRARSPAASGTVPDADGMAVAGGLTVSAVAGRPLHRATFGRVGESGACARLVFCQPSSNSVGISGVIENKMT